LVAEGVGGSLAGRRRILPAAALLVACAAACAQPPQTVGGCRTTEREYGLPARADSLALLALGELTAPGMGEKTGPAARRLGADTPLFITIGAVDPLADTLWARAAERLDSLLAGRGMRLAARSGLRHTTGPCFPPYHVDLRAVSDSARVDGFRRALPLASWGPLAVTAERARRVMFVTAGASLQSMDTVVDLRIRSDNHGRSK
jgi:hypothetical protein